MGTPANGRERCSTSVDAAGKQAEVPNSFFLRRVYWSGVRQSPRERHPPTCEADVTSPPCDCVHHLAYTLRDSQRIFHSALFARSAVWSPTGAAECRALVAVTSSVWFRTHTRF